MKKLSFILIGLCIFLSTNAQISNLPSNQFTLSEIPGNNKLIESAIGTDPGRIEKKPSCAFIFEYGDGYFTTQKNSTHYYADNLRKDLLLSLSGRYDTTTPPPRFARSITPDATNMSSSQPSQSILNTNETIKVTPIATTLNVKDEMVFIVTYKIPVDVTNAKIIFYYNQNNNIFFNPILTENSPMEVIVGSRDAVTPKTINRIRTHFGENNFSTNPSIYSIAKNSMLNTTYSNAISYDININRAMYEERNIFISLKTADNFTNQANGDVEAVLVYSQPNTRNENQKQISEYNQFAVSSLSMPFFANPHDPNYISVMPKCLLTGNGLTKIHYKIHFQNEGGGTAHKLFIKVNLDSSLKDYVKDLTAASFKINVGNEPITTFIFNKGTSENSLMFEITPSVIGGKLDSSLSSNKVPVWFSNPLTMGDIYFSLNIPHIKEADLGAFAAIRFFNGRGDSMPDVITNTDTLFIRKVCNGKLFPLIKALADTTTKAPLKPTTKYKDINLKSDQCYKILGLCWWWWIVILLALLLSWFIISKNRKKEKDSTNNRY